MSQQKILLLILGTNLVGFAIIIFLLLNINSAATYFLQIKKAAENAAISNKISSNRDAVVADLDNLGYLAQQYYRKPTSMGGGGNTFTGWEMPLLPNEKPNGNYSLESISAQKVIIIGVGIEMENGKPISYRAIVNPTSTDIQKIN